ncbi:MAG: M20/M25/M40 family metallo-hydrolase [Sphingobacteriales bacterium]|nr:MAG: M20/M25/M40 family metallo-hydrolase [Sphingobacteriales bacterium]
MKRSLSIITLLFLSVTVKAQQDSIMMRKIADEVLLNSNCYDNLRVLCKQIGHRLSGTPEAAKAVEWGQKCMEAAGADKVWLQAVEVPNWVRGKESLQIGWGKGNKTNIPMLSIGNTDGTDGKMLTAQIIMVGDLDEFNALPAEKVKGKVIFFNHRFVQTTINPFHEYGESGKYRWTAPNVASARGAAAVIIRSISTGEDDAPHTGSMRYADTVKHIPAVAIGNKSADLLAEKCKAGAATAMLRSECKMMGTVRSYNVIGEIRGSSEPEKFVVVGGHLDSWDVGEGAHDDGAGCVQSIEVIRALKALNIKPKYTIRAILFMNEENGLKGGTAYADSAKSKNEKHLLAIETDAGGFSPRGFGLDMKEAQKEQIRQYRKLFMPYGVYDFEQEEGGADISPLKRAGVPTAGLLPDPQRYFDLHHTANDVFEAVSHRELKMGALTLANLVYLVSEHGLR